MNRYLKNLCKIEFVITNACTGRCRHCSEGEHTASGESIDPNAASEAVRKIVCEYDIKTVMTFGGEPLLFSDTVCEIMRTACELNVPKRQVITNGFFTKDKDTMTKTAKKLSACGVNDLLLSVDAFHQETIPLDTVKEFAREVQKCDIPLRLQPAWLISSTDKNPYDLKTREIIDSFRELDIYENEGNVVFPEGNALKYLSEYFQGKSVQNPYVEDPYDVKCVSFSPDGAVLGGNIYMHDIVDILNNYDPEKSEI